jgi:ubiquinone/menaquinone biosynthesis C-methylase UbiE
MVQTTEQHTDLGRFYDELADDYDAMTGFERRFPMERPFFKLFVEQNDIHTAVDAGAGTGFHSILLAQLGVKVEAVDLSPSMLERLTAHAKSYGLQIRATQGGFEEIPRIITSPVDALFCLGNGLPHLRTEEELDAALRGFHAVLRPGGVAFLHLLNYHRILATQQRIQSVKEDEGGLYVRFYDFEEGAVRFNILRLGREGGSWKHTLRSLLLHPWQRGELTTALERNGFRDIRVYGGVAMDEFVQEASRDLVLFATA